MEGAISLVGAGISAFAALVSGWFTRRTIMSERLAAADELAVRFREPLLQAAYNLQGRMYNIVRLGFLDRFMADTSPAEDREYAAENTLYLLGQYFCWVEILRRESQYLDESVATIETPFLQLVMTRLWSEKAARGSRTLRHSTLVELGGAERIVRTHLDSVMAELSDDQREVAACVFRHLVTPSGMKIAHTVRDLAEYAEVSDRERLTEVLEQLSAGRERVLRPVPPPVDQPGLPRYEIFHDVMAPAVLDWRRRYVAAQDRARSEQALVQAKQEAEERDRQSRRRLRRSRLLSGTLALLLVFVLVLGSWVQRSRDDAQHRERLAVYEQELQSDPAASLHAALQAWRKKHSAAAERAVRTAFDADTARRVFGGHRGLVVTGEFSPDGRTILTSGDDGTARLVDTRTGEQRTLAREGDAPRSPLTGASFSPDGSMVVTTAADGRVYVYDDASADRIASLGTYRRSAFARWGIVRGRAVVLTSSWGGPAALWDPTAPDRPIARYGTSSNVSHSADLSRDGTHVVTVDSSAPAASVWEATTGRLVARSATMDDEMAFPRFVTGDSSRVALIVADRSRWEVVFWDWRGSGALNRTDWAARHFSELTVSKDGRWVIAGLDKRAVVFDAATGEAEGSVPDQADWVNAVDLSPDGRWLVTAGSDGRARVWLAGQFNDRPVAELLGHRGGVSDARFHPRDPWLVVSAGNDGTARTWRVPERTVLPGEAGWILDVDVSRDGRHVVTAEDNRGWLRVWRADNGALENQLSRGYDGWLQSAVFSPDGNTVVAVSSEASAPVVWRWRRGADSVQLDENDWWINRVGVSLDGRTVAAGDYRNRVVLWDLATGRITGRLAGDRREYAVVDVVYIPGSPLIAAGSSDGTVRLWDPSRPDRPRRTLQAPAGAAIRAIDVSRDCRYLAAAAENYTLRVWRVSDGRVERTLDGPRSTIGDVALSPDGSRLAVGAADAAVHVGQRGDGRKLAVLRRHGSGVDAVEFVGRDGNLLVSASDDSMAAVYRCTTCGTFAEVLRAAERRDRLHEVASAATGSGRLVRAVRFDD